MCGIYGVISRNKCLPKGLIQSAERIFKENMGHRGPDESGIFLSKDGQVLLGHLRLSIIDLESGQQPMLDSNNVVSFNGEIYNFEMLREASSYRFLTNSDTEVILSEYSSNSEKFCNRLNGMYSFALYDMQKKLVKLAVDPVGIKSLYVYRDDEVIVFASELVALCKFIKLELMIELEPDLSATVEYLINGMYLGDKTPVRGISKLLPGSIITIENNGQDYSRSSINYKAQNEDRLELSQVVKQAVSRQLVADVPVCLFLSGGIDSSLLALSMKEQNKNIKAFTFSFKGQSIDESSRAIELANMIGLECELVEIRDSEIEEAFDSAIQAMDEPINDMASIPLTKLVEACSKEFKVCLVGDGGDELFYGYIHHKYWRIKSALAKDFFVNFGLIGLLERLSYFFEGIRFSLFQKLGLLLKLTLPFGSSYGPFSNCSRLLSLTQREKKILRSLKELEEWEWQNSLNRKLLQKTDRITMKQSIEARVPLLDLELIAYSKQYSIKDCVVDGVGKYPLRALLNNSIKSKHHKLVKKGFRTPTAEWLRDKLMSKIKCSLFKSLVLEQLISHENLGVLISEHSNRKRDHSSRIFALYALAKFWEKV